MTWIASGRPGQPPRFGRDERLLMLGEGEVSFPLPNGRPTGPVRITADGTALEPLPPPFEGAKAEKLIELVRLASARLDLWTGGTAPAGGLQVDDTSTGRITSWALKADRVADPAAPLDGLPYWIMADNSHRPIASAADFLAFAEAAATYKTAAILHAAALKKAVREAADASALAAIDITAGWPA